MELCNHLTEIYQMEIKMNNILSIGVRYDTGLELAVFFANPMSDHIIQNNLEMGQILDTHYPKQKWIICNDCKMMLSFPLEANQQDKYAPSPMSKTNPLVITTKETIYIDDSVTGTGIIPLAK